MKEVFTGLFWDMRGRAERMLSELRPFVYDSSLPDAFWEDTCKNFDELLHRIDTHIVSEYLDFDVFNAQNVTEYTTCYIELEIAEFKYMVVRRYSQPEVTFSHLLKRVYGEIKLGMAVPVVLFISNTHDYYRAYCGQGVIVSPLEEVNHLLNWPDLYHEIAHFIVAEDRDNLLLGGKLIPNLVDAYFTECKQQSQLMKQSADIYDKWHQLWQTNWLMEFTCDMIATYLTGPAYAWSNFRLSSIIPQSDGDEPESPTTRQKQPRHIYVAMAEHPPNEARMQAIFHMLTRCGWEDSDGPSLKTAWKSHTDLSINRKNRPNDYDQLMPEALITALVEQVFIYCQEELGILTYSEQLTKASHLVPISHLLNLAWQRLLTNPTTYSAWETDIVAQIYQSKPKL